MVAFQLRIPWAIGTNSLSHHQFLRKPSCCLGPFQKRKYGTQCFWLCPQHFKNNCQLPFFLTPVQLLPEPWHTAAFGFPTSHTSAAPNFQPGMPLPTLTGV